MERHPIVFLSAWRSAAKRQASNLMLDLHVPSSQKKNAKTMQNNKNILMYVPYFVVAAFGSMVVYIIYQHLRSHACVSPVS